MTAGLNLQFPQIQRIQLESFSLYENSPDLVVDVTKGVTCIAGANGIGKSTFLAAITYGLTGAVPLPERRFKSPKDYLNLAREFNSKYFDGRIDENDRDSATISLDFTIGDKRFQLLRGFFDPFSELRNVRILSTNTETTESEYDDLETDWSANQKMYEQCIADQVGLSTFEQFVFLQHFVFTFDESRHLLFWEEGPLEQALHLCFGGDPSDALKLERLRKKEGDLDSRGRNRRWHATKTKERLEVLNELADEQEVETAGETMDQYEKLLTAIETANNNLELTALNLRDAETKFAAAAAQNAVLKNRYTEIFSKTLAAHPAIDQHPLVHQTLADEKCGICGSEQAEHIQIVRAKLDGHHCPLCNAPIGNGEIADEAIAALKEADKDLAESKELVSKCLKSLERLKEEHQAAQEKRLAAATNLEQFEDENESEVKKIKERKGFESDSLSQTIKLLQEEYDRQLEESREAYKARDEIRKEIEPLGKKIEKSFAEAEDVFVPIFRELAELFIGLDLDIRVHTIKHSTVTLELELEGSARRAEHQLSESQRFFLDIALRMALAQYVSSDASPAPLFIDTPEGSLDIAYESRAGQMFARFAQENHNILMTANINTSELLKKLAHDCGRETMNLIRMTAWTELSSVQRESEEMFNRAFEDIEGELSRHDAES